MKPSQHPDTVAPEGLEEALAEARRQRDLLQRRLAVEAALDRVRARTMAMQESAELRDVVATVYEQLRRLDFDSWGCNLATKDEAGDGLTFWMSNAVQTLAPEIYHVPRLDHPVADRIWAAWEDESGYQVIEMKGAAKRDYTRLLLEETDLRRLPDPVKAVMQAQERVVLSQAFARHSILEAAGEEALPEDKAEILQRFARVFEQTYTRFLDLQKAEAQAREAEIQLALERVRARTMGMHKSEELKEVVSVLYEQLDALGLADWGCSIMIFDKASHRIEYWVAESTGSDLNSYYVEGQGHPVYKKLWTLWEQQGPPLTLHHTDEVKREFDEYWLNETDFKALPEEVRSSVLNEREVFLSYISMRHGLLNAAGYKHLPEEKIAILQRFAYVFEQTYTRFLDLKLAEEQAREAQIEAALERVRARSMAMHNSDELEEVIVGIFEGLESLGFDPQLCNLNILNFETRTGHGRVWSSFYTETGLSTYSYFVPFLDHPLFKRILKAYEQGEPYLTYELGREDRRHLAELLFAEQVIDLSELTQNLDQFDDLVGTIVFMSQGRVDVWRETALDEDELAVIQRFTKVVDLTYTRFDDLRKAETQARESQIEAALERVRARAMGMHHSDELKNIVSAMFEDLERLGIYAATCAINLFDSEAQDIHGWAALYDEAGLSSCHFFYPRFDHPMMNRIWEAFEQGESYLVYELAGADKLRWDELFYEHVVGFPEMPQWLEADRLWGSYTFMSQGLVVVWGTTPLDDDEAALMQRFTRVVDLTYTRFDDLQQAEARAREAVQQASLDRVRAEIASMRHADDLERITPLIWRELTTLGVPFFRCGVFIIDEANEQVHTYLSTPEGRSLAVLHLPFDSAATTREAVAHWRQGQVYTDHWDREQFVAWVASMREQGYIDASVRYQGGDEPPETLALQFVPFTQGMLYVGSAASLADDQIDLVQALADAFAVAYARYEDFTRLEAAKAEVEATLADLKATQAQLIHSEKMASLGQMTAGIAHEIKNPLNFVNNFSEIVVELSDELQDLLTPHLDASLQGEADDFRMILGDLKQNASVIAKHGRRADDIVRAMMQHAREGTGTREATAINALVEEYVNLAYHGMRASTPGFSVEIERAYGEAVGQAPVMAQELGRVLLNLLSNALYAVHEHAGRTDGWYAPSVTVTTCMLDGGIEIRIGDNGPGIPAEIREKIFEPFFTTKPTGAGTGLGLSLSYDIVTQGHGGTLAVESTEGEGATFIVTLPNHAAHQE